MPMKKSAAAESPDAYVASLGGWQRRYVEALRSTVVDAQLLREAVKWGHLVYFSNGPVLLIRAEETRVLFGFWRGQRLQDIEPRLKPGGKYEMATLQLVEETPLERSTVVELVKKAVALNASYGDPTAPQCSEELKLSVRASGRARAAARPLRSARAFLPAPHSPRRSPACRRRAPWRACATSRAV